MKFIIREYGNVVDVSLHPDTKRDILKGIAWQGTIAIAGVAAVYYIKKG